MMAVEYDRCLRSLFRFTLDDMLLNPLVAKQDRPWTRSPARIAGILSSSSKRRDSYEKATKFRERES